MFPSCSFRASVRAGAWAVSRLVRFPPWVRAWVSAAAPGTGKKEQRRNVSDSCAIHAGKHIGGSVLIALNFSAGPGRRLGLESGRAVRRGVGAVWCRCHVDPPLQAPGRAAPLAANGLSVEVPAGELFCRGLFLVSK